MPYQLADRSNVNRIGQTIAQLMLQQGDINAQRAEASGQIWGGLAQNLGQAVGQGVQAYQTQRAEQREAQAVSARTAKFLKFAQTWDGNPQAAQAAALETYGPTPEAKVAVEGLFAAQRLSQEQRAQTQEEAAQDFQERIGAFGALGRYYEGLPENERQQVFSALYPIARPLVSELVQRAGGDPSALPEETPEWTPEADQAFISMSRQLRGEEQPQEQQPRTLEQALAMAVQSGDAEAQQQILTAIRQKEEATRAPADPREAELGQIQLERARLGLQTDRQKAAGGPEPVKLPGPQAERVAGIDQSLGIADNLERVLDSEKNQIEEWLGPARGLAMEMSLSTPGVPVSEDLARFAADTATLKNSVIKAITGAQVNKSEEKRIMQQIPLFTDKPVVWRQKLASTRDNLRMLKTRIIELSTGQPQAPPIGSQGSDQAQPTEDNPLGLNLPNRGQ